METRRNPLLIRKIMHLYTWFDYLPSQLKRSTNISNQKNWMQSSLITSSKCSEFRKSSFLIERYAHAGTVLSRDNKWENPTDYNETVIGKDIISWKSWSWRVLTSQNNNIIFFCLVIRDAAAILYIPEYFKFSSVIL